MRKIRISTTEEIIYRKTQNLEFELDDEFVQFYQVQLQFMLELNPNCPTALVFFCVLEMDDENFVSYDAIFRKRFREFLALNNLTYSDIAIKKAMATLKNLGWLESLSKGRYRVSLFHVWKGKIKNRLEEVKKISYQDTRDYRTVKKYLQHTEDGTIQKLKELAKKSNQ